MMKKNWLRMLTVLTLMLSTLVLASCSTPAVENSSGKETAPQETTTETKTDSPDAESSPDGQKTATLEELLGEDYMDYLTDTITMQMGNRMDKNPEIRYFPIEEDTPLSDYVTIDETTKFEVDEEGNLILYFPAGTVSDEANGEQSFRIPKLYPKQKTES